MPGTGSVWMFLDYLTILGLGPYILIEIKDIKYLNAIIKQSYKSISISIKSSISHVLIWKNKIIQTTPNFLVSS